MAWTAEATRNIAAALADALRAQAAGDTEGQAAANNAAEQIMSNPNSKKKVT